MPDYYERNVGICRHTSQEGRVFIDIGANEGAWALPFSINYDMVHAFEPDERARAQLLVNLRALKRKNINVHWHAIMDYDGVLEMETFDNSVFTTPIPGFRSSGVNASNPRLVHVPCVKLDTIVKELSIDLSVASLIKIDVEGGELAVLAGAKTTIATYKPELFIEIHSTENKVKALEFLGEQGYDHKIIRHPDYKPDDVSFDSHLWIDAWPRSIPSTNAS